jgi:hypothetical protein
VGIPVCHTEVERERRERERRHRKLHFVVLAKERGDRKHGWFGWGKVGANKRYGGER